MTSIIGWAHSKFGRQDGRDLESLIGEVTEGALADAGIAAEDIDSIHIGHFNAGLSRQSFPSSLAMQAAPGLRFKPATRYENACASGSAAIYGGLAAIASGGSRLALVIGAEKMTELSAEDAGKCLLKASYVKDEAEVQGGFAGVFAHIAKLYFQRYGDQSDALAHIAAKNHRNGAANPYAHLQKDLGYEFCRNESDKNPVVADPLKRTDCSLISDGAAAIVLAAEGIAAAQPKAIGFRATAHVNDFLPMASRDIVAFEGAAAAWNQALDRAGLQLLDLSLVETHDCFTIAELMEYEAMGLTPKGQGGRAILNGWVDKGGRLPVNPSGGLKAKGHPVGATGVSMHVMAALQLMGEAGGMQIPDAKLVGIFNMGGAAVANYVSILERRR